MPKIRRRGVPGALLEHLWLRIDEREISIAQLELFAVWLDMEPDVPEGKWFKRFPEMVVCGEGEFVTTFLRIGQVAEGEEVLWIENPKNDGSSICSPVVAGPDGVELFH